MRFQSETSAFKFFQRNVKVAAKDSKHFLKIYNNSPIRAVPLIPMSYIFTFFFNQST